MLLSGPLPVSSNELTGKSDLHFRPFQRVTAEVMQVSGAQAVLSIDGTTIVARLTSPEQAAALQDQRSARFIVLQTEGGEITLKLLPPNPAPGEPVSAEKQAIQARFLQEYHLPDTAQSRTLLHSILAHRLPLSAELFGELSDALASLGSWDAADADLAAALKAAGLPVTTESLRLAASSGGSSMQSVETLFALLKNTAARENLPAELRVLVDAAQKMIEQNRASLSDPRAALAQSLRGQVEMLGRSLENLLLDQLQNKSALWPENSLLLLGKLAEMAGKHGEQALGEAAARCLDDARALQLQNGQNEPQARVESWIRLPLALVQPQAEGQQADTHARLYVRRQNEASGEPVDSANTRLVIELEVSEGKTVQVNLSLSGRQAWADVAVSDEGLSEPARTELEGLQAGLNELGWLLTGSEVRVGRTGLPGFAAPAGGHSLPPADLALLSVDVEI